MTLSFAQKLGVTAALLGCATRKELCARFRAANPATEFDLERSFKWLQGKSLPRSITVYDDWARLLGVTRGGAWLAACSTDAFVQEVCALFQADPADVQAQAAVFLGARAVAATDGLGGDFVTYSWAWSPFRQGRLIRGTLELRTAPAGRVAAVYSERMESHTGVFRGGGTRNGRTLQLALAGQDADFMAQSLLVSGRPSDCFCGMVQGFTTAGTTAEVSACRIVGMRLPEGRAAEGPCYISADPATIARDLGLCGFDPEVAEDLAAAVLRFLGQSNGERPMKVSADDLTEVARALALAPGALRA